MVRKITYHIDVACPYHNLQKCSSLSISQFLENDLKNGAMQFTRNSKWSCVSISFVAAVWLTNGLSMGTYTLNILWTPLIMRYFSIFFHIYLYEILFFEALYMVLMMQIWKYFIVCWLAWYQWKCSKYFFRWKPHRFVSNTIKRMVFLRDILHTLP